MTIVKTRPALLTTAQRQQFTEFPDPDDQLLARHYTLSDDDLVLIGERRRNSNRLGFAVQLCVLRHLDKVLDVAEAPPTSVLSFLGEQLGIDPDEYAEYASREPTRREHFLEALAGFQGARSWMKRKKPTGTNGKPYGKAPSNLMDFHRLAHCFLCEV